MEKKKFFGAELHSVIYDRMSTDITNRGEKPIFDDIWFSAGRRASELESKYPELGKKLVLNWKNTQNTVDHDQYIARCEAVIKLLENQPVSNRRYSNTEKEEPAIWGRIHLEWFETFKEEYKNWAIYGRELSENYGPRFRLFENFNRMAHMVEDFVLIDRIFKWKPTKKNPTPKDDVLGPLEDFVYYFFAKKREILIMKETLVKKRRFKKAKKQIFAFHVKTHGQRWSIDWYYDVDDEFDILISHINEESARDAIAHNTGDMNEPRYEGAFKELCNGKDCQISHAELTRIEPTKEVVASALERQKKKWNPRYDRYGGLFQRIDFESEHNKKEKFFVKISNTTELEDFRGVILRGGYTLHYSFFFDSKIQNIESMIRDGILMVYCSDNYVSMGNSNNISKKTWYELGLTDFVKRIT